VVRLIFIFATISGSVCSLVECKLCGREAVFVKHVEQHLEGRVLDLCRACHMKVHWVLCKEPKFTQNVFLVGEGERVTKSVHIPKDLHAEFQRFCHNQNFSMSLIITVGIHYFVQLVKALSKAGVKLPVETVARIAGLSARAWMEWAKKAYEIYEPPIKWGISKVEVSV